MQMTMGLMAPGFLGEPPSRPSTSRFREQRSTEIEKAISYGDIR